MKAYLKTLTIALFALIVSPVYAIDTMNIGIKVGDTFPAFTLENQNNKEISQKKTIGKNGSIFMFVRSVDWCPYCKEQVKEFKEHITTMEEHGYDFYVFSYDSTEKAERFSRTHRIPFDILNDANSNLIKEIGILNNNHVKGQRFYGIPHPHIYVVNNKAVITHKFSEENYKKRPSVQDVISVLK